MRGADLDLLAMLPGAAFAFMLLLCRVGAAVMLVPGFGEAELPGIVRAGISLALAFLLLPVVAPLMPGPAGSPGQDLAMVAAELACGALLGWLARLIALALPVAGQLVSVLVGLSNVLQPDPSLGAQSSALGRLFSLTAPVVVLGSGLYALPLAALAGSYKLVPPGAFLPAADSAQAVVAAVADSFRLAIRLAAPFVLVSILWQVALGLLSRLVPQLQVSFAGMPGQVLGGLLLLAVLMQAMLGGWAEAARAGFAMLPGL